MMKKGSIVWLLLVVHVLSYGQTNEALDFTPRLQGIKQNDIDFFELEGYQIYVRSFNYPFTKKGMKKARRKLKIKRSLVGFTSDTFQGKHRVVHQTEIKSEELKVYQSWYLFEEGKNRIKCFAFGSVNKKDSALEQRFVKAYRAKEIPPSVYTDMQIDSIDFAGRKIALGPSCHWAGVHNVQCPNYGQMNWSMHTSFRDAEIATTSQLVSTEQKSMGKIVETKMVDVVFEGVDTKAKRVVYKIKLPRFVMGGSNILIIYYVTAKVRDNFISCVMSHYTDDVTAQGLPPLLAEVMALK